MEKSSKLISCNQAVKWNFDSNCLLVICSSLLGYKVETQLENIFKTTEGTFVKQHNEIMSEQFLLEKNFRIKNIDRKKYYI